MSEKFPDSPAFKRDLTHSEHDPLGSRNLYEFEHDPRYIVRVKTLDFFHEGKMDVQSLAEAAPRCQKLFDDLKRYGIDAPVQFIRAADTEGTEQLYIVTENVHAAVDKLSISADHLRQNAEHGMGHVSLEEVRVFEAEYCHLFERMLNYYTDAFAFNSEILTDIAPISFMSQFAYGKRPGDIRNRMYLIDTDPYFHRGTKAVLTGVSRLIYSMEHELKSGLPLQATYAQALKLREEIKQRIASGAAES